MSNTKSRMYVKKQQKLNIQQLKTNMCVKQKYSNC